MNNYCNHSGGCSGADMEWDAIGRAYGFENHKHYRPADLKALEPSKRDELEYDIYIAAQSLGRPTGEFPGKDLVRRNWFQAKGADAIYAVSRIVESGALDKGFVNKTGRQIVSGGTAWACEMAMKQNKPVHVFDMNTNYWYCWNPHTKEFDQIPTPCLTHNYAGIGSRLLNNEARQAIRDVYTQTLRHASMVTGLDAQE